jgi:hypothetical protein
MKWGVGDIFGFPWVEIGIVLAGAERKRVEEFYFHHH